LHSYLFLKCDRYLLCGILWCAFRFRTNFDYCFVFIVLSVSLLTIMLYRNSSFWRNNIYLDVLGLLIWCLLFQVTPELNQSQTVNFCELLKQMFVQGRYNSSHTANSITALKEHNFLGICNTQFNLRQKFISVTHF